MSIDAAQSLTHVPSLPSVPDGRPRSAARPNRIPGPRPAEGVAFTRLVRVELRKMTDTVAGRWLVISVGALIALVMGVLIATRGSETTFSGYLQGTSTPISIILPIVGILAVTTEWSTRSGIVSFVLEPRRGRVAWAKAAAGTVVALAGVVVAFVLAALATLVARAIVGGPGTFDAPRLMMAGAAFMTLLSMAQGLAFGMLLRSSAAAIVAYFALPTVYSMLGSISWLETFAEWTDLNRTLSPLLIDAGVTGAQWAQLATSVAVWAVLPFVVGMWLVRRAEVK